MEEAIMAVEDDRQKTERLKALHKRVIEELWNRGDYDIVDEHLHPELRAHLRGEGFSADDVKSVVREFRDAFPDLRVTVDSQVAEGDRLVSFSTMTGTHRETFRGIAPSGNSITMVTACDTTFRDEKVIDERVLFDQLDLMKQLDVEPRGRELFPTSLAE
jgi:predicted ester cyclase